jgi:hypothetical protein
VTELESATAEGVDRLAELLQDRSGSSASRIRNDLAKPVDDALAVRLLAACHGDAELRDRIQRYAHLVRTDPWGYPLVYPAGSFIVTTGSDRRETGAHYTPKSLTEAIVIETLTPVVYFGPAEGTPRDQWVLKSPSEILELKICDPAMGSGAFLVQACRWLAERLVEAWSLAEITGRVVSVDGTVLDAANGKELLPRDIDARTMIARRLIAERCLYGVDLNPLAVELAKLSIWLVTLAKGRPFGFLDHNLRSGNSLLGIHRLDQLTELTMTPTGKGQQRLFGQDIERAVHEAIELRQRLRALPIRDIRDVEAMARLDADARKKLEVPELIADAFIGEVFASGGNANVWANATASLAIQAGQAVVGQGDAIEAIARRAKSNLSIDLPSDRGLRAPFHWPIEFPEAFSKQHPGFDAIVGNPPFLGGKRISTVLGLAFNSYLSAMNTGASKNTDLVAHFFRRSFDLLVSDGCFGLLATNTIAEGDTRQGGLEWLLSNGAAIYAAWPNEAWPGAAAVVTSRIHIRKAQWIGDRSLAGKAVKHISAFLSDHDEWSPKQLRASQGRAFQGSITLGMGFVIDEATAQSMIEADPQNANVVLPYLGGDDLNSDPNQRARRWVINFWDWPESRAQSFKLPYLWIKKRVYPERLEKSKDNSYKNIMSMWWLHWNARPGLFHALGRGAFFEKHPAGWVDGQGETIALGTARLSKYLTFSHLKYTFVASDQVVVVAPPDLTWHAILDSAVHHAWAWQFRSTRGVGVVGLRYSQSDLLETFAFPRTNPSQKSMLRKLSGELNAQRARICEGGSFGLTKTYNFYHDPENNDLSVAALRNIHRRIDLEVCDAYGWGDLNLEHGFHEVSYLPDNDRVRFTISESVRAEVLRRLSALNRQRYQEEATDGLRGSSSKVEKPKAVKRQAGPSKLTTSHKQAGFEFEAPSVYLEKSVPTLSTRNQWGKDSSDQILAWLEAHKGWFAKQAILNGCGATMDDWNAAIAELLGDDFVEIHPDGSRWRAKP